jgi:hypothetical protein
MRRVLAVGLLVILCAPADAATVRHPRARQHAVTRPPVPATPTVRFAVPGWSDEATSRWLNNASSMVGIGG